MLASGGFGFGKKTATAGTRIRRLLPPRIGALTRLIKIIYTAAGTAHTITVLRPIGRTTLTAATAAAGTVVNLTADPNPSGNPLAANDLVAVRETDNVTRLYVVSSVTSLAVTLTAGLTAGAAANAKVWSFGVPADTDPVTGEAHPTFDGVASATTTYEDREVGIVATTAKDDPLLIDSDNATAAGTLALATYGHTVS